MKKRKIGMGGTIGSIAGGVLGQALIPIPGVGATIGKTVGGMAGNAIDSGIEQKKANAEQAQQIALQQAQMHLQQQQVNNTTSNQYAGGGNINNNNDNNMAINRYEGGGTLADYYQSNNKPFESVQQRRENAVNNLGFTPEQAQQIGSPEGNAAYLQALQGTNNNRNAAQTTIRNTTNANTTLSNPNNTAGQTEFSGDTEAQANSNYMGNGQRGDGSASEGNWQYGNTNIGSNGTTGLDAINNSNADRNNPNSQTTMRRTIIMPNGREREAFYDANTNELFTKNRRGQFTPVGANNAIFASRDENNINGSVSSADEVKARIELATLPEANSANRITSADNKYELIKMADDRGGITYLTRKVGNTGRWRNVRDSNILDEYISITGREPDIDTKMQAIFDNPETFTTGGGTQSSYADDRRRTPANTTNSQR